MIKKVKILTGTANPELAKDISKYLNIPLTPVEITRFNDGEIYCRVLESVRGNVVFIIQPTSPNANEHLMELLILADALKRASAKEINAVIPYFGYARQERKVKSREPITAKLVADLLQAAGVNRVITFDLHADQIQGFFNIPTDNLEVLPLIAGHFLDKKLKDIVVVSPDSGGTTRARRLAELLNGSLAIFYKRRPKHGESQIMNVIGDVKDKNAILIDDLIDTAGTITNAALKLKELGAKDVYVAATHAILSGPAIERLSNENIESVIVTDTVPIKNKKLDKIKVISIAKLLAESIRRIYEAEPMGVLFDGIYDKLKEKVK